MIIIIIKPRLCKGIEKTMKHEGDDHTNCDRCVWYCN